MWDTLCTNAKVATLRGGRYAALVPGAVAAEGGKIVELAGRNAVHGQAVKNAEALANPEALEQFRNRVELRG